MEQTNCMKPQQGNLASRLEELQQQLEKRGMDILKRSYLRHNLRLFLATQSKPSQSSETSSSLFPQAHLVSPVVPLGCASHPGWLASQPTKFFSMGAA